MVNTITNHTTIQTDINTILNKDTKNQASTIDLNLKDLKDLNIPSIIPQNNEQSKTNLHNNAINQLTKVYNPQPIQVKDIDIQEYSSDFLPGEHEYTIDNLFEKNCIHMICAPVHAHLLPIFLRLIADWKDGLTFLENKCNPQNFIYIDNHTDQRSLFSALRRLSISPGDFRGLPKTHTQTIEQTLKQIPENTTVFINHLPTTFTKDITQGEAINSPSKVSKLMDTIQDICDKKQLTLIFTHLLNQDKRPPIQRVFGSTMWASKSVTTITIDPNPKIPLNYFISIYNDTNITTPFYGKEYKLDPTYGYLKPATTTNTDIFVSDLTINQLYSVSELQQITGLQKSRIYIKLKQAIKTEHIKKVGSRYLRLK